jgi:hypothetical protein
MTTTDSTVLSVRRVLSKRGRIGVAQVGRTAITPEEVLVVSLTRSTLIVSQLRNSRRIPKV